MLVVFVSVFMSKRVVGSVHVWLEVVCVVVVQSEKLAETGENKSNYVHTMLNIFSLMFTTYVISQMRNTNAFGFVEMEPNRIRVLAKTQMHLVGGARKQYLR